jgi:hypothetical protein
MGLRVQGLTLQEIGDEMGISGSRVHAIIRDGLRCTITQPAEELRALELARCDALLATAMRTLEAFHPLIHSGNVVHVPLLQSDGQKVLDSEGKVVPVVQEDHAPKLAAIAAALRVMERRAKLLGLDAPVVSKSEVTVQEGGPTAADLSHLTPQELEEIKTKLYGTNGTPTANTPVVITH